MKLKQTYICNLKCQDTLIDIDHWRTLTIQIRTILPDIVRIDLVCCFEIIAIIRLPVSLFHVINKSLPARQCWTVLCVSLIALQHFAPYLVIYWHMNMVHLIIIIIIIVIAIYIHTCTKFCEFTLNWGPFFTTTLVFTVSLSLLLDFEQSQNNKMQISIFTEIRPTSWLHHYI